jgi:hypothetical protein
MLGLAATPATTPRDTRAQAEVHLHILRSDISLLPRRYRPAVDVPFHVIRVQKAPNNQPDAARKNWEDRDTSGLAIFTGNFSAIASS